MVAPQESKSFPNFDKPYHSSQGVRLKLSVTVRSAGVLACELDRRLAGFVLRRDAAETRSRGRLRYTTDTFNRTRLQAIQGIPLRAKSLRLGVRPQPRSGYASAQKGFAQSAVHRNDLASGFAQAI